MSNEDQTLGSEGPLVARDGVVLAPSSESKQESFSRQARFEAVARALKGALSPSTPAFLEAGPGRQSISGATDVKAGREPRESLSPPNASGSESGPGATVPDLNAVGSNLGDLLTADPGRPGETEAARGGEAFRAADPLPRLGNAPPTGQGADVVGAGSRTAGDGSWGGSVRGLGTGAESDGSSGQPLTGLPGSASLHPGFSGVLSLAIPALGGREAEGISATAGIAVGREGVNPISDQVAFAPWSSGPGARGPGASPYSIDIREASASSSAFGPVLSSSDGSGYADATAEAGSWGLGGANPPASSADSWSGRVSPDGADQAGGSAPDLSRTNDLLQQLLEEVRRGRQPFLPLNDRNSSGF